MSEENSVNTNTKVTDKPKIGSTEKDSTKKASPKKTVTNKTDIQNDFLKSFNWHQYQEGIDELDEKQIKEFEKLVEKNFVDTSDDNIIQGEVIHLTDKDVIIDIGGNLYDRQQNLSCA